MKKFMVLAITVVFSVAVGLELAGGSPPWKSQVGAASCETCHKAGAPKKDENPENKNWATAKDMAAKMKAGQGDFAGKTKCKDCHDGKMKPEKK